VSFCLDLNTEIGSQLIAAGGREFQVADAAQPKDHLPMTMRLNGTLRDRKPVTAVTECRCDNSG